ncbi:hypothetical protein ABZ725_47315 [Streptomyces sp. NPDC006872]|uniref:hypothetical protein n=1 Tax=Streptomyces sp. NPDC006872 TaxID=3155720 RepID=UPI0033E24057
MGIAVPSPPTPAFDAAAALLAAHPGLSAESVDIADANGLGPTALIRVQDRAALRDWAKALNVTARTTGESAYGTAGPQQDSVSDWLWWRMTFIDTTVDQTPIRLWTLDATDHPRALVVFLASAAHTPT